ncbi:MAG: hypothetical protein KKE62_00280 [Proteobacteria bacterium]|nr:hypothetical protein [Pseudomonadota bacterium]MBU1389435.1 hypothetical protein [Pseudomonadota bacterium]MBU1541255.1 hypothetical protein [Pseudomonadota bacterium]MBU2479521.1 hypothetical protein [Pseudomonadota bacterium]
MEDISRELEREIALTKPKPHKQDRKTQILIVDDFGKMKSGEYLKQLVIYLSIGSAVCFVIAILFFFLYMGLSRDSGHVKTRLGIAEKKLEELTREKEVLMARLVIQGKTPGVLPDTQNSEPVADIKKSEKKPAVPEKQITLPAKTVKPEENTVTVPLTDPQGKPDEAALKVPAKKKVSIEKFTVTRDHGNGDLLVRFDIRNTSLAPGDVSGRIFTVLKPESEDDSQWLVVPTSSLKDGIPFEHRKGQYFSIAHFKPVKFRIKNQADPQFFKKASIFIFDTQGELMFHKLIDITEEE